jgi:zinc-binding alcohol dehydrogenase/oxidoreductase
VKALQITGVNELRIAELPEPVAAPGEAVVKLRAAALNHRDVWIKSGQYAGIRYPCTPGSDGSGVVVGTGPDADPACVGREVVINPSLGWGADQRAQGPDFAILGLPRPGTLATHVAVPASQLSPKPAGLAWEEAAALPLAGLTAWRALFARAGLRRGERLLITGIGGGVALLALQFAAAAGAKVWVTSSSGDKIARAVRLGAQGGFVYSAKDWTSAAADAVPGGFDVILDSAGGEGFPSLIDVAASGGRIVFFGATRGNAPALALRKVFWRQLTLIGSTMGSPADWEAMTGFAARHGIRPVLAERFPLDRAGEAFALMERGGQFGKIVLTIPE